MVELKKVTPHVVAIDSGWSGGNVGGVSLENFIVAIDTTKNYPKGVEFRESLETHFNQPVKFAFITHHHSDHTKGMDAFDKGSIISTKWTAKKVRNLTSVTNFPSITFEDSYIIEDGELHAELHHSGGHTLDSAYLLFPKENVIFAGDLIFEGYPFFSAYKCNPHDWIAVLEHFRELKPTRIVPGHGPILSSLDALEKHITLMYRLKKVIKKGKSENIEPRLIEIPKFVLNFSKQIPESELIKWFRRTAVSWYRHL